MNAVFHARNQELLRPIVARFMPGGPKHLSDLKLYSIYAISVYDGVTFYLVVDDLNTPVFLPASLFELKDAKPGQSWLVGANLSEQVLLVIGPHFICDSIDSYSDMVDQVWASVERLWRTIDSGDAPPPHP